jgi:hypothetical protein
MYTNLNFILAIYHHLLQAEKDSHLRSNLRGGDVKGKEKGGNM